MHPFCTLAASLLLLSSSPGQAALKTVNKGGQTFDMARSLTPEKPNLVFFNLSSSQPSRNLFARLPAIAAAHPEMDILVVDLSALNSPVAREFNITTAPAVMQFDAKGNLIAQGNKAFGYLVKLADSR